MADYRRQRDEYYQEVKDLEALRDHPGYQKLLALLDAQVMCYRQQVFNNGVESLDGAFRVAKDQGTVAGILLAKALHQQRIDDLKQDIATINELIKETDNESR